MKSLFKTNDGWVKTQNNLVGEVRAKYSTDNLTPKVHIRCAEDSAKELRQTISEDQIEHREFFTVLFLNRSNHTLGWSQVSSGGVAGTVADPKIIFQMALLANASSIILCHNHPSGKNQPSEMDNKLTRKVVEAGKVLDIPVLDHIILTKESFYSYSQNGKI